MKVLYVITGLGIGGAESQLSAIALRMAKTHEVCVCYLTGEQKFLNGATTVHTVPLHIKKTVLGFFCGYFRLRALVREFQPDVVHSHMVHANILSRLLRLTLPIPRLVCSAHNTYEGGVLRMLAYRLTDRLSDVITNVSQEAVLSFEAKGAVPKGKMKVAVNGIDTERFKADVQQRNHIRQLAGVTDSLKIILAVGRLAKAKDYPNVLTAFARLSKKDEALRLWIVGEGDEKASLEQLVTLLGIVDQVVFWGVRTDIAELHNAADIFVLSSAWEGFGLVVAEAMATEKVVVATDCGGVAEVMGTHGFLVPPRNAALLAQALSKALSLSCEQKAIAGAQARERITTRFSLESVIQNWQHIYNGH